MEIWAAINAGTETKNVAAEKGLKMSNELQRQDNNQVAFRASPAQSEAGALMTIIERISTMPDLDMDRVERLFQMHKDMLDRQQEQAFNDAMAQAQRDIQGVVVNKTNTHTRSRYADIEAIHAEAKPVWTKHGFSVLTRTAASEHPGHIKLICEVRHAAGHKVVFEDDWPLDLAGSQGKTNKTAIQGKGSTITYARRYTELMIFDIAIRGEDNDGQPAQPALQTVTPEQIAELRKGMLVANLAEEDFLKMARVARIEDIAQIRFEAAMKRLKKEAQQ